MKLLVQKFGGSSVSTPELRELVAQKIMRSVQEGYATVVVVSAIGRVGDPYATDTLLGLARKNYSDMAKRELDLLMACGEIISGVVLVSTLLAQGYDAVFLTGGQAGIVTDNSFGDARILKINPERTLNYLKQQKIVVVAGFQGCTEEGEMTTLGRGGSDTTAAALGVALRAEAVDIYTDVDGIMTADPRIVKGAKMLEVVTYNEICQLAQQGAKVIHPRAVEIAMQQNIPLRVKCTFNDSPGTLVTNRGEILEQGTVIYSDRPITGITQIANITQLKVITRDLSDKKGAELKIFKALALANVSVDFINVNPDAVMFTVSDDVAGKAIQILQNMNFDPEALPGCAKVSAVGAGMAGIPGVMASIVEALTKEEVQILQSSDSHTTIWCLVRREDMDKAVQALHEQFRLGE